MKKTWAYLRILVCGLALQAGGLPAYADWLYTPGAGPSKFLSFNAAGPNTGTGGCAATNVDCMAMVPVNTAGAQLGTASVPVRTDPTGSTPQPVSASALPLPTGAATSALQGTGNTSLASILSALGTPFQAGGSIGNTGFNATLQSTPTTAIGKVDPNTPASWGQFVDKSTWSVTTSIGQIAMGEFTTGGANACATSQACAVGITSGRGWLTDTSTIGGTAVLTGSGAVGAGAQRVAVGADAAVLAGSALGLTVGSPLFVAPGTGATFPVSAASLPLPAGAATSALQTSILSALGTPFQAGGSIGNTSFIATQSTAANLNMTCANCSGSGASGTDKGGFTASSSVFAPSGGVALATPTTSPLVAGQWGVWQLTLNRAGMVNLRDAAGNELGTAAAPIRNDPTGSTTQPVSAVSLPLPSGAATAALQSTINTTLGTPFQAGGSIGNTSFGATQGNAGSNAQAWWARIGDATNGPAAVKPASTAAAATDPALVVAVSPNNTLPIKVASGQVASGAYAAGAFASGLGVDGWDVTEGTKTDAVCTIPTSTTSCSIVAILKAIANASSSPGTTFAQGGATAPTNAALAGGTYNSTQPTLTTGQSAALQLDPSGNLRVVGQGIPDATSVGTNTGSGVLGLVTTSATTGLTNNDLYYLSLTTARALRSDNYSWGGTALGAPSNYGTSPGAVAVPGTNSFVTNTVAMNQTQVNGNTLSAGTGAQGSGSPRVTVATDQATNAGAALVKGGVGVVNGGNFFQAVAASQTAATLQQTTGAAGDYLSHCDIYPTSTSPGVVTVFDNTNTAASSVILFPGGATSLSNLAPISVPVGAVSAAGAWKVTTGAGVSAVCFGRFS